MRAIIFIFIFLVSLLVIADPLPPTSPIAPPLNEASVAVADQTAASLQIGLQAAFSDVMVRMSGNPTIMSTPQIQEASKNVMQWLQSYSYSQQSTTQSSEKPGWILQVVFNRTGLEQLLQSIKTDAQMDVPPSVVQVTVIGIKNMNDYTALIQAMREKVGVAHVGVGSIMVNRVILNVQITQDEAHFEAALSEDVRLKPLVSPKNNLSMNKTTETRTPLYYLWVDNSAPVTPAPNFAR